MTTQNEQRIRIVIEAQDRASQQIQSVSRRLTTDLRMISRSMLILGGVVSGFTGLAVRSALQQRVVVANVTDSLNNMGLSYEALRPQIQKAIDSLQEISGVSEKDALAAFTELLRVTGNYDASLRALPAAAAMAAGTGQTIQETAKIIGQAMAGDKGAIELLQSYGLNLGTTSRWTDILAEAQKRWEQSLIASNTPMARSIANIKDLRNQIGNRLIPVLEPLLQAFSNILGKLGELIAEHPKLVSAIAQVIVPVGVLILAFGAVGMAVTNLMVVFGAFHGLLTVVLPGIIAFVIANPIVALILAITAIILVLQSGSMDWKSLWETMRDNSIASIKDMLGWIKTLVDWIDRIPSLPHIPGFPKIPTIPNIPGIPFISGPGAMPGIATFQVGGLGGPLVTEAQLTALREGVATLINGQVVTSTKLQQGGIVRRPTLAMLGERGSEAVIPLSHGIGMGRPSININFHGPVYGLSDFNAKVLEAVRNAATRGGFEFVLG